MEHQVSEFRSYLGGGIFNHEKCFFYIFRSSVASFSWLIHIQIDITQQNVTFTNNERILSISSAMKQNAVLQIV